MPYSSVAELPPAVRSKLKGKKLRQWMHVFNSEYDKHGDESRAFASAWATAQKFGDVAKAQKQTKDEVKYQTHPHGKEHCGRCTMFRQPDRCTAVAGDIVPEGWCNIFAAKPLGKVQSMNDFTFFVPLAKVNEKKRTVSGYASTPTKDSDGEIVTLAAIKSALPDYMSYGNIREMHALKAVGTAQEANIDTKGLFLTAKIVDDAAWKKCMEGVYKGFSIGGKKLAKEGDNITKLELTEISVVDRPANPDCKINIAKSASATFGTEGHLMLVKEKRTPEAKALAKMAKVVGELAKAGPPAAHDGFSLPAKTAAAAEPSPKDDSTQNNKAANTAAAVIEDAGAKTAKDAEDKKKKKKAKKSARKAAKAQLLKALGLGTPSFLTLGAEAAPTVEDDGEAVEKGMGAAGSLAYSFDSLRSVQRQLLSEAKREGGDMKDKALAKQVGAIAKQLAEIISQKASHEGDEATTLTDADDQYLSTFLGEDFSMDKTVTLTSTGDPMTDAVLAIMKRAAAPTRASLTKAAKEEVEKSRKAMKECRKAVEEVHKMLKADYINKAAKKDGKKPDDDGDFDSADAMGKLNKAYEAAQNARTFGKAAISKLAKAESMAGRAGQRGQEAGDGEGKFYSVPAGVRDLSPSELATASPGGNESGSAPPVYPVEGGVYPGKAEGVGDLMKRFAKNGVIPAEVAELIIEKAKADGELAALRAMPAMPSGGRRPVSFNPRLIAGGSNNAAEAQQVLFKGVDVGALNGADERAHTEASAKVIGNLLTNTGFAKSVLSPDFRGAAGS